MLPHEPVTVINIKLETRWDIIVFDIKSHNSRNCVFWFGCKTCSTNLLVIIRDSHRRYLNVNTHFNLYTINSIPHRIFLILSLASATKWLLIGWHICSYYALGLANNQKVNKSRRDRCWWICGRQSSHYIKKFRVSRMFLKLQRISQCIQAYQHTSLCANDTNETWCISLTYCIILFSFGSIKFMQLMKSRTHPFQRRRWRCRR